MAESFDEFSPTKYCRECSTPAVLGLRPRSGEFFKIFSHLRLLAAKPCERSRLVIAGLLVLLVLFGDRAFAQAGQPFVSNEPCSAHSLRGAIRFLREKVRIDQSDTIAASMLVSRLLQYSRMERYFEDFSEVRLLLEIALRDEGGAAVQILQATALKAEHRFQEALNVVHALIGSSSSRKSTEAIAANLLLVDVLTELSRIEEASNVLRTIVSDARDPLVLFRKARLIEVEKGPREALPLYRQATSTSAFLEQEPFEQVWLLLQLGEKLTSLGYLDESEAAYSQAAKICPSYWVLEEHRAEIQAIRGDKQGARSRYLRLLHSHPRAALHEAVAALSEQLGDRSAATEHVLKAKDMYVRSVQRGEKLFIHHLAVLYDELLDEPCAGREFAFRDIAMRRTPQTLLQAAWTSFRCGNYKIARQLLEEATGKGYSDPHFDYRAGILLSGLGSRERGRVRIARAIADNPWVNAFHAHR